MSENININDISELEKYFSENLKSPLFPILADLYYDKADYDRSKKVCQIGIKANPKSTVGYYILSKIALIHNNLKEAEKLLKKSIDIDNLNLSSMNLLFSVQIELDRSKVEIKKNVNNIIDLDHSNNDCRNWLNDNYKIHKTSTLNTEKKKKPIQNNKLINDKKEIKQTVTKKIKTLNKNKENIEVNNELASMTLFNIYKSQGYYQQALQVLNVLKDKEKDKKAIKKEIKILNDLIEEIK